MRFLTLLFTLFAVLILAWSDFAGDKEQTTANKNTLKALIFIKPSSLSDVPLDIETAWQQKAQKVKQAEQQKATPKKKAPTLSGQRLSIGDKEFALQGIFYRGDVPFVLLKSSSGKLLSVKQGDTVEQDVVLARVSADSITLTTPDISKEFKLFQRQSNENTH